MRNLGLKTIQFSSVFNNVVPQPMWASPARGQAGSSTMVGKFTGRGSGPAGHNPRAQSERLGPVWKSQSGRRIDKPLHVDKMAADRIRKASLCHYFYLRGQCVTVCQRNHVHRPLTDEEFDALWDQARQGKCAKSRYMDRKGGEDCQDMLCVYRHTSDADDVLLASCA